MEPILQIKGISKQFPGVKALDQVSFDLRPGEVHALVGENGAGKSTLMNILGGIIQPDEGEIRFEGKNIHIKDAHSASLLGISVVFQELSLVPILSVAENIFTNRQPVNRFNIIKSRDMLEKTQSLLSLFGDHEIQPGMLVKFLPVAKQQVVEILKAISYAPKVLILDEPTSSLTHAEIETLFQTIHRLKKLGTAIIYISHHMTEIIELADRVTVLRDGKYVTTEPIDQLTEDKIVRLMVGRELLNMYGERDEHALIEQEVLKVKQLARKGVFQDISFSLCKGEILGIAGLVGAGRTEVGRAIFGAEVAEAGDIYVKGKKIAIRSPKEAIRHGIGYLTENRKEQGLYLDMSIKDNIISPSLDRFAGHGLGFIQDQQARLISQNHCERFKVAAPGIWQKIGRLSGGNQQKVLLSMWVGIEPEVLIIDEPTRGVDVGAKSEIYAHLRNLTYSGVGIILISSDLPEVMGLSDRILVMRQGRIVTELDKTQFSEETIISYASGIAI